jgi:hypothetical protein
VNPKISECAFEDTIECGLLQDGPDAWVGEATTVRETPALYGSSANEYIRTRFAVPAKAAIGPADGAV